MIAEMWKSTLKTHIHKIAKSKPASNKLKEEICFILNMHYSLEQKKVDKTEYFLSNNKQTKKKEGCDLFQGIAVFT